MLWIGTSYIPIKLCGMYTYLLLENRIDILIDYFLYT